MSMVTNDTPQGSLERLQIPLETRAPEDVLTPNAVKAVRFRKSKPWGILEEDVLSFRDVSLSTVQWFLAKLHERDMDVHRLGQELDNRETQIANFKIEVARLSYNSTVKEAIDRNEDDKEMADLMNRFASVEVELRTTQAALVQAQQDLANQDGTQIISADAPAVELEQAQQALTQAQVQLHELLEDHTSLLSAHEQLVTDHGTLQENHTQLEAFVEAQETYIDTLLTGEPAIQQDADLPGIETPPIAYEVETEDEIIYAAEDADIDEIELPVEEAEEATYGVDEGDYEDEVSPAAVEDEDSFIESDIPVFEHETVVADADLEDAPVTVTASPVKEAPPVYMYDGVPLPPGIRPEDL